MNYLHVYHWIILKLQVPHKMKAEKAGRIAERAALEEQKRNQSYALLSDSEEEQEVIPAKKVSFLT